MPRKREIEVKFVLDDSDDFHMRLTTVHKNWAGEGKEINIYFENPFNNLLKQEIVVRLRRWRHRVILTSKKNPKRGGKYNSRQETEMITESQLDFGVLREILIDAGLVVDLEYHKERRMWILFHTTVSLDTIEDGRMFVELEGAKRNIRKVAKILGLDWNRVEKRSYPEIIKELRAEKNK